MFDLAALLALFSVGQHCDREPELTCPAKCRDRIVEDFPARFVVLQIVSEEAIRFRVGNGGVDKLAHSRSSLLRKRELPPLVARVVPRGDSPPTLMGRRIDEPERLGPRDHRFSSSGRLVDQCVVEVEQHGRQHARILAYETAAKHVGRRHPVCRGWGGHVSDPRCTCLPALRGQQAAEATGAFTYKTVQQGAATTLVAVIAPELAHTGGHYLDDGREAHTVTDDADLFANSHGVKQWALDLDAAMKLWAVSLELSQHP
jgi:hypothetical protein